MRYLRGFILTLLISITFTMVLTSLMKSDKNYVELSRIAEEIKILDKLLLEDLITVKGEEELQFESSSVSSKDSSIILNKGHKYKFRYLKIGINKVESVKIESSSCSVPKLTSEGLYLIQYDYSLNKNIHKGTRFKYLTAERRLKSE